MLVVLLLLLAADAASASGACDSVDLQIYRNRGGAAGFAARFRTFGGLFVSREEFESAIMADTGLSTACASCYGASYVCGKSNCMLSCGLAGERCDRCLREYNCTRDCNKCTGF